MEKSIHFIVQHAITLMVIKLSYGYCYVQICNLYFSLKKSDTGFYYEIYTGSSADLCQPDLITIRQEPKRAIKLLSKIQEDACFVGFKQILPYKVIAYD